MNFNEWESCVLDHILHGEDGSLQLSWEDAAAVEKILLKNGYAVCMTGGDTEDTYILHWIYGGDTKDLSWANYDNICFTSADYANGLLDMYYTSQKESD